MDLQQMQHPQDAPTGNPPMLGADNPVTSGTSPAQSGLSVMGNPMAEQLQSQGRGEDSMLVHMTPNEVNSLQGLAMAHGGSLTINPHTGLVEAGWLGKLLPTLLGAALAATGVGAPLAAGIVGLGQTALTGSLKKGLMAGLGAFGGASLAGAAGLGGAVSKNAFGVLGDKAGLLGANMGTGALTGAANAGATLAGATPVATSTAAGLGGGVGSGALNVAGGTIANAAAPAAINIAAAAPSLASSAAGAAPVSLTAAKTGLAGLAQRFGQTASQGLPGGIISKAAPMLAASGLMQGVSGAMTPSGGSVAGPQGQVDNSYQGPYYAQDRKQIMDPEGAPSGKQRRHFAVSMPEIYNTMGQVVQPGSQTVRGTQIMQPVLNPKAKKGQPMYTFVPVEYQGGIDPNEGYAHGGEIELSDGAFVLDARTVSEIGNGSSNAGMEALRRLGGQPVQGPGDGVSDSVPARIGRNQPARVARDEVIMPAEVVRHIGKGNPQRGADKLYALMDKAHKARKKAGRGQDTKLSRGLA